VSAVDQADLLREHAANNGFEAKDVTAEEIWSDRSWDSID
jgi:hypothetical protein